MVILRQWATFYDGNLNQHMRTVDFRFVGQPDFETLAHICSYLAFANGCGAFINAFSFLVGRLVFAKRAEINGHSVLVDFDLFVGVETGADLVAINQILGFGALDLVNALIEQVGFFLCQQIARGQK